MLIVTDKPSYRKCLCSDILSKKKALAKRLELKGISQGEKINELLIQWILL